MAKVLRGLVSMAALGWLTALGLTAVRISPGDTPGWAPPLMMLALSVAGTATIAAVVLYSLPPVVEAYRLGVQVGEHHVRPVPETHRARLRPVR